jgi:hypothetical protein
MKYITEDGIELTGGDFREIVRKLKKASPLSLSRNEREYMRDVANRVERVRTDTPAHFIEDLESQGFLKRVRQ